MVRAAGTSRDEPVDTTRLAWAELSACSEENTRDPLASHRAATVPPGDSHTVSEIKCPAMLAIKSRAQSANEPPSGRGLAVEYMVQTLAVQSPHVVVIQLTDNQPSFLACAHEAHLPQFAHVV